MLSQGLTKEDSPCF